jgi:uncharacterized Zn finger protein (UPF0148 family)
MIKENRCRKCGKIKTLSGYNGKYICVPCGLIRIHKNKFMKNKKEIPEALRKKFSEMGKKSWESKIKKAKEQSKVDKNKISDLI